MSGSVSDWGIISVAGSNYTAAFGAFSLAGLLPLLFLGGQRVRFVWKGYDRARRAEAINNSKFLLKIGPPAAFTILIYYLIATGALILRGIIQYWDEWNRQASVAYDFDCQAVHIAISPWRQYLDIDGFGRTLRVVKAWFNA